ncbi:N-acetylmuramoyl-L-alanine amidase AmiC precursor [Candidatus Ornithobacterium hominis]|uniref:N-acetylmuramoyl-L-alanine amidase n=2 Tax=Candidatus Ornithobacterium hominis TaxID=2497989 RepID=A0A383U1W2_9FLAO|nr:N-acetylmuramoyl-L-alanine amidase AmiC precursor [Candidatus Ornithobacterium hominis]
MNMKKKNVLKKSFIVLLIALINPILAQDLKKEFVLVLDAGHGGHDSGAAGVADVEKNITLDIVLELGKLIKKNFDDVKVIYTREDDTFVTLAGRADIANRNHADFFISVHCNSARPTAYGSETFVLGTEDHRSSANLNVVKKENSVILLEENHEERYSNFDPNKPESLIGLTLMQNVHLSNSLLFAKAVEDNFINKDKRLSRGVKQAGFVVLWRTATPSVLIEVGFISNPAEGKYLASKEGKKNSAESIFNAFKYYKTEWDKRQRNEMGANEPLKKVTEKPKIEKPVEDKYFKIQFLTSNKKLRAKSIQLKGLDPVEVLEENGLYKYFYGQTSFISKREELLNYVKRKGFPDAFVVEVPINTNAQEKETQEQKNIYRIQILTSSKKFSDNAPQLKGISPVDVYEENKLYRYYYGWFSSENEAEKELPKIKKAGFQDAFIVKFINGKKE